MIEFYLRWLIREYKSILRQPCIEGYSSPGQYITVTSSQLTHMQSQYEGINNIIAPEIKELPSSLDQLQYLTSSALDMRIYAANNQWLEAVKIKYCLDQILFPNKSPTLVLSSSRGSDRSFEYPGLLSDMLAVEREFIASESLNSLLIELGILKCWTITPKQIIDEEFNDFKVLQAMSYVYLETQINRMDSEYNPTHQRAINLGIKVIHLLKRLKFSQVSIVKLSEINEILSEYEYFKIDSMKIDHVMQYVRMKQFLKLLLTIMDDYNSKKSIERGEISLFLYVPLLAASLGQWSVVDPARSIASFADF